MSLYRETPCEHCGEPYGEHDGPVTDTCDGSGGSRTEVTIDIEAAFDYYYQGELPPEGDTYQHFCNAVAAALTPGDTDGR